MLTRFAGTPAAISPSTTACALVLARSRLNAAVPTVEPAKPSTRNGPALARAVSADWRIMLCAPSSSAALSAVKNTTERGASAVDGDAQDVTTGSSRVARNKRLRIEKLRVGWLVEPFVKGTTRLSVTEIGRQRPCRPPQQPSLRLIRLSPGAISGQARHQVSVTNFDRAAFPALFAAFGAGVASGVIVVWRGGIALLSPPLSHLPNAVALRCQTRPQSRCCGATSSFTVVRRSLSAEAVGKPLDGRIGAAFANRKVIAAFDLVVVDGHRSAAAELLQTDVSRMTRPRGRRCLE